MSSLNVRSHFKAPFCCDWLRKRLATFSGKNVLDGALWHRLRAFLPCGLASRFARTVSLRRGFEMASRSQSFCCVGLRRGLVLLGLVFLIAGTSGCASLGTYNPATGRKEVILLSTPTEVRMGQDIHQQLAGEYVISKDQKKVSRLMRIGQDLAAVSDRQDYVHQFYLLEDDTLNAFTTPGGNIYMNTGLMARLTTDSQIAAVLAHEIGHGSARHIAKKFQAAMGLNLVGGVLLGMIESQAAQQVASMSSNAVLKIVFASFSRQDEYQADALALKYLDLAGYDVYGMLEVLVLLQKESKGPKVPIYLRTHPYLKDRILEVQRQIRARKK